VHAPHEFVALEHLLHDMRLYKSRPSSTMLRRSAEIAAAGAPPRDARRAPGVLGVPGRGRTAARVPPQRRRTELPPHRRRRRERLHAALQRQQRAAARRRPAADRRRLRIRLLRLGHHPHLPGQRPLHKEQRALYELVLEAQAAAIAKVPARQPLERAARRRGQGAITQGLVKLGLLKGGCRS
jgi:Xaa-Pro aminopeptidase